MATLDEDVCTFMIILRSHLVRMRSVSDRSCRENQNTLICIQHDATLHSLFYLETALHAHQERKQLYLRRLVFVTPLLLPATIASQPAATWVNTTRYCKYSQVLLMMGENIARNM
jgi:hypothetical protein